MLCFSDLTPYRGMLLHTITILPKKHPIKAVVCFCHGYTDSVSFMKLVENQRLAERGIAVCAIEYEGHGLSDGALGLFNDWRVLISDVSSYFAEVVATRFPRKPMFLMGESMGGAVAYSVQNAMPSLFQGVVFLCPMCKISDNMLPPQPVIDILKWLIGPSGPVVSWLGYLPIAPAQNSLENVTHRVLEKRHLCSRSPLVFGRNPRLATARELIDVTQRISRSLHEFDAPFLVLHGKADIVTDPQLSQALYDESPSKDKSIHLYEGMWHSLTSGEPDENIDRVFQDCIEWILKRA
jgi:alpha-beta hydrolase superfamily lysophospholipase